MRTLARGTRAGRLLDSCLPCFDKIKGWRFSDAINTTPVLAALLPYLVKKSLRPVTTEALRLALQMCFRLYPGAPDRTVSPPLSPSPAPRRPAPLHCAGKSRSPVSRPPRNPLPVRLSMAQRTTRDGPGRAGQLDVGGLLIWRRGDAGRC